MSNKKQFLLLSVIYLIIFSTLSLFFDFFNDGLNQNLEIWISSNLISWFLFGLLGLFIISIVIITIHNFFTFVLVKALNENDFHFWIIIKKNSKHLLKILLFSLIEFIIVALGIIFFFIPGIYYLFVFSFSIIILANENLSFINSFKKATKVFRANLWSDIKIIALFKLIIWLCLIIGSFIKINGFLTLIDWFITTILIYLLIYNPIENKMKKEIINSPNE